MIIDIFKRCLKEPNVSGAFVKELQKIYVEQDKDVFDEIKKDYIDLDLESDLFKIAEDDKINSFSVIDFFEISSVYHTLFSRIKSNKFLKCINGEWLFARNSGVDDLFLRLKFEVDRFLNEKNVGFIKTNFFSLMQFLFEIRQAELSSNDKFAPNQLIENGLISDEKSISLLYISSIIEKIRKENIEIDYKLLSILIQKEAAIKKDNIVWNGLINIYGEINKDGNYLLNKCVLDKSEFAIECLLPILKSFVININDCSPGGKDIKLYDMAKMYELNGGLCELIKQTQERIELIDNIRSTKFSEKLVSL